MWLTACKISVVNPPARLFAVNRDRHDKSADQKKHFPGYPYSGCLAGIAINDPYLYLNFSKIPVPYVPKPLHPGCRVHAYFEEGKPPYWPFGIAEKDIE